MRRHELMRPIVIWCIFWHFRPCMQEHRDPNDSVFISFEFDGAPDALVYKICGLWAFQQSDSTLKPSLHVKLELNHYTFHKTHITSTMLEDMRHNHGCWTRSVEPAMIPSGIAMAQAVVCSGLNCNMGIVTSAELINVTHNPFRIVYLAGNEGLDVEETKFVIFPEIEVGEIDAASMPARYKADGSCLPLVRNDTCFCSQLCEHYFEVIVSDPNLQACAQSQQRPILGIGSCRFHRAGPSSPDLELRYIELAKASVLGLLHGPWKGHLDGSEWPPDSVRATSMIGQRRMDHMQFLLEEVIRLNVPGDFIEAGAWRGGATMVAAAVLLAYGQACPSPACRRVFVADSFRGIPPVDAAAFPADAAHAGAEHIGILRDNSADRVRGAFAAMGLLSDAVVFLEGWFRDSLPAARRAALLRRLALVRLDGDTYEATWIALDALYDLLSPGGFVVVDDYTDWIGCHRAVTDFRARRAIAAPLRPVHHGPGEQVRGVWWQKPWSAPPPPP